MVKSTVVIPNYNGIRYIEDCLDSLYAGTQTQFEVIMVDNASTDGSRELVQEKFPQVKLICNETNTGFSEAVNQGIQASTTPYVILLNNDTRADKAFIHELEKAIEKDARIFSASAKLISLHDMTKLDDAGDYYCALGWAFARGKGKAPALYEKEDCIFAGIRTVLLRQQSCIMQGVQPPVPDIMRSRPNWQPGTVSIWSIRICHYCRFL